MKRSKIVERLSASLTVSAASAFVLVQACGSAEMSEKADVPDPKESVSAAVELGSGIRISEQLGREFAKPDRTIGVAIHLGAYPAALDEEDEDVGSAAVENGEIVEATLNGVPATAADFGQHARAQQKRLAGRDATKRAWRKQRWLELGEKYGIGAELAQASELGLSSASVELPPSVAKRIADGDDGIVGAMEAQVEGTASLSSALSSLELSTSAFPSGWKGDGLGIFVTDFGKPSTSDPCINNAKLTQAAGTTGSTEDHATLMICLAQAAAPGAHVLYRTVYGDCGADIPAEALNHDPPIYVSTQSDNWFGDRKYHDCDGAFDDRVLDTRIAHFNSAGNWAADKAVFSPAVAYNVVTVGGYNDEASPDSMWAGSNYADPLTGASKPELVGPAADNVDVPNSFQDTGGTSVATPLVAGFATDLMEQLSFLRGRPQVLKSYMMANAVRIDSGAVVVGAKDGAGRPDYSNAKGGDASTAGWSYWWSGSNGSYFSSDSDGDGRKEIHVTRTLAAGTYHVVANWLVDGGYVAANGKPNMDIDLAVQNSAGTLLASSDSSQQTVEATSFTLTSSTSVKFILERYWNSGTGPVVLGMVVRKR